jgi:ubiquinone/menaquinone biosynthesis C-methylase UbiE
MLKPTERFTTRVENYIKYRPHYPTQLVTMLQNECGLTADWRIADIGAGTGILTKLFLDHGNVVDAIEPNQAMREAAERLLHEYPNFRSIDATAETTTLADSAIDLITAGQAFHWFDLAQTKQEFLRILKPGGLMMLAWNDLQVDSTPFLKEYMQVIHQYSIDVKLVHQRSSGITREVIADFFSPEAFSEQHFHNEQVCDFKGLIGRVMSASYAPEPDHPNYQPMVMALRRIFDKHQTEGSVRFDYDTRMYYGRLKSS